MADIFRADLKKLTALRVEEARVLLKAKRWAGAAYLIGYAVECALKARIAKLVGKYQFPDKVKAADAYTHDLKKLVRIGELEHELSLRRKADAKFAANWDLLAGSAGWSERRRYQSQTADTQKRGQRVLQLGNRSRSWRFGMDREVLVRRGNELFAALKRAGITVTGATWLHSNDTGEWHLILATPAFDERGLVAIYEEVEKHARSWPDIPPSQFSIGVVSPKDSFVRRIEQYKPTGQQKYVDIPLNPSSSVSSISSSVQVSSADRMIVLKLPR